MIQRLVLLLTAATIFFTTSASASNVGRKEVLQLYQESLFQETGICDLKLAKKLYLSIITKHKDYRDIIAVVMYRLGVICEKNGEYAKAKTYYTDIVNKYGDQEKIAKQAEVKLAKLPVEAKEKETTAMTKQLKQRELKTPATDKNTESNQGTPASGSKEIKSAKSKKVAGSLTRKTGIGINANEDSILGIHFRYRIANNLLVEAKSLFDKGDNIIIGGRVCYMPTQMSNTISLLPYTGMDYAWTISQAMGKGYAAGGFVGAECVFFGSFSVGADLGYYYKKYENLHTTMGIDFHGYITAYF